MNDGLRAWTHVIYALHAWTVLAGLFTPVLVVDGSTVLSTKSELSKATVTAKVIGQAAGPKVDGFTYKRRTNQRRRFGHRQKYSLIEITSIAKG